MRAIIRTKEGDAYQSEVFAYIWDGVPYTEGEPEHYHYIVWNATKTELVAIKPFFHAENFLQRMVMVVLRDEDEEQWGFEEEDSPRGSLKGMPEDLYQLVLEHRVPREILDRCAALEATAEEIGIFDVVSPIDARLFESRSFHLEDTYIKDIQFLSGVLIIQFRALWGFDIFVRFEGDVNFNLIDVKDLWSECTLFVGEDSVCLVNEELDSFHEDSEHTWVSGHHMMYSFVPHTYPLEEEWDDEDDLWDMDDSWYNEDDSWVDPDTNYRVAAVTFDNGSKEYHYLCDDETIEAGDLVTVLAGSVEKVVTVKRIFTTLPADAPYPIHRMKSVLGKASSESSIISGEFAWYLQKEANVLDLTEAIDLQEYEDMTYNAIKTPMGYFWVEFDGSEIPITVRKSLHPNEEGDEVVSVSLFPVEFWYDLDSTLALASDRDMEQATYIKLERDDTSIGNSWYQAPYVFSISAEVTPEMGEDALEVQAYNQLPMYHVITEMQNFQWNYAFHLSWKKLDLEA